jgi:signal transduction histidine kinase
MVADVAHELRTPLTVIQGNLQAILDGVYPLDTQQVAGLYDETRLLTRLVDDLRDLALAEAGQLRIERLPVDLYGVAKTAVAGFAAAAEAAGVTLALDGEERKTPAVDAAGSGAPASGEVGMEAVVDGDADRLAQVLRNLLSNALRHTPAGGAVTVRIRQSEGRVQLQVADTGSGIAPEDLPNVFDRFYRADKSRSRRGGGAGLGLAIARQIVLAHDGDLTVESRPGAGATFTVTLPEGAGGGHPRMPNE